MLRLRSREHATVRCVTTINQLLLAGQPAVICGSARSIFNHFLDVIELKRAPFKRKLRWESLIFSSGSLRVLSGELYNCKLIFKCPLEQKFMYKKLEICYEKTFTMFLPVLFQDFPQPVWYKLVLKLPFSCLFLGDTWSSAGAVTRNTKAKHRPTASDTASLR